MAKARLTTTRSRPPTGGSFATPTDVTDTDNERYGSPRNRPRTSDHEEKVPPAESSSPRGRQDAVLWSELSSGWKIAAAVGGFFVAVVIPFAVYLTSVKTGVEAVTDDVKELKIKTEGLLVDSGKQAVRIDHLERRQQELQSTKK